MLLLSDLPKTQSIWLACPLKISSRVLSRKLSGRILRTWLLITRLSHDAVNIPLNDLRTHLEEIPKDKHIVVSCKSGQRAYYTYGMLKQHSFENVDNLGGSYATFHSIHPNEIDA